MKKKIIIVSIIIIAVILVAGIYLSTNIAINKRNVLKNVEGEYSSIKITDFDTAKQSIDTENIKNHLHITSIENELQKDKSSTIGDVLNTYKFKQIYNGIEVYQKGIIVYTDKDGNAKGIIEDLQDIKDLDITPKKTIEDIDKIITKEYGQEEIKEKKLIIYPNKNTNTLAYEYVVGEFDEVVIIDANSGKIISNGLQIYQIEEKDLQPFLKNGVYELTDENRSLVLAKTSEPNLKTGRTKYENYVIEQDATLELEDEKALEGIITLQKCYDYYKDKFSYYSLNGNYNDQVELTIIPNVKSYDLGKDSKNNNFEDNACFIVPQHILLGSNHLYNSNVEVLGHEYTHGVFAYRLGITGNDKYSFETKALNEAYADIMGMCIEAYYNNTNTIDGIISSVDTRNIKDSNLKYSYLKLNSFTQFKDEHKYSTIISKAAYLMSENMSLEQFEKLWFNSMELLPKNATFADCEYAVIRVAEMMDLGEETINAIKNAFLSVGMPEYEEILGITLDVTDVLDNFPGMNKENDIYMDVLNGEKEFIDEYDIVMKIDDYLSSLGMENQSIEYTILDMDQDEDKEMVVLFGGEYYLIFNYEEENDTVYAFQDVLRGILGLKTNGLYVGSGGAATSGLMRSTFQRNERIQETLAERDFNVFKIGDKAVSEAEYNQYMESEYQSKEDVKWTTFQAGDKLDGNVYIYIYPDLGMEVDGSKEILYFEKGTVTLREQYLGTKKTGTYSIQDGNVIVTYAKETLWNQGLNQDETKDISEQVIYKIDSNNVVTTEGNIEKTYMKNNGR